MAENRAGPIRDKSSNGVNIPEEFLKPYNPAEEEPKTIKLWDESGYTNPDKMIADGLIKPDAESYSIVLPPPNVTGTLHMGHAAMLAIEDILIRYARMNGKKTLWIPGTDSAAIATQAKVEKEIYKEEKKTRHDLGRDELLKRIEAFTEESKKNIINQVRTMGASLDWSRYAYTLDEKRYAAVMEAFVRMYDAGLIYRGDRIVNWDPKGQTTISDDEIVYEERQAKLYTFKYSKDFPIAISTTRPETKVGDTAVAVHLDDERYRAYIGKEYDAVFCDVPLHIKIVADESVEKDFGTGALGVTPAHSMTDWEIADRHNLPRPQVINEYAKMMVEGRLKDKKTKDAREEIVAWLRDEDLLENEEDVTQNISTAERTGGIIEPLPKRQWFIAVNKKAKFPDGKERTLKEWMHEAVESGQTKIAPERFEKIYYHWIDNLRDWCISRQIWFGHRIPVWYRDQSNDKRQKTKIWNLKIYGDEIFNALQNGTKTIEVRAGRPQGSEKYWGDLHSGDLIDFSLADEKTDLVIESIKPTRKTVGNVSHFKNFDELFAVYPAEKDYPGKSVDELKQWWAKRPVLHDRIEKYGVWVIEFASDATTEEIYCGVIPPKGEGWEQDLDTLDTWFSSGLWTFSTLGWPGETADLKTYHPTSVLETGYDILFFWVARMILMSGFLVGQVPFKQVYLHGLVRDGQGRKMSKSLGNIINPLDMITKYGADATRLSLIIGAAPGTDLKLSEDRVRGYKHFANKLWNIARFVLENIDDGFTKPVITDADQALIAEIMEMAKNVSENIEKFRLDLAADSIYHFVWDRFAAEILEESKVIFKSGGEAATSRRYVLYAILTTSLKLLHPFMPFVTEAIWQKLPQSPQKDAELLMVAKWPTKT
ncbi:hypothetical protein A3A38_04285 [Candidatus Kaiserbacteria bacterium RIFCSPLOWO2_01_FULL_53_17]|uniref:valine--tRNA ligase n=1 Tax=Candidatus Kaiserbacteria bacterium RIFCSPLOWO2_01_FULL_53_17 TaxID=1798511 RepID=A0A1F6EHF7_9BACT|nr:MAG: hypothetical protein A3A38_04285 [Candidatus Kaiserbacteria bacterium RIFCSPLOWO2_01_FULL_53_17]